MRSFFHWVGRSPAAMRYIMACSVIAMAYFILQKLHHRDGVADFRVYYEAARALFSGGQVYGEAFGVSSGFYKYSPFAALPFGILCWMPYGVASGLYYFFILAAFILFSLVLTRHLEVRMGWSGEHRGWVLTLITVFLADHFERELHLGNVNVLLLIAAYALYSFREKGAMAAAGWTFAFILLYKPHFLILLPYFIWKKDFKLVGHAVLAGGIGLLLPFVFTGWAHNAELLSQWFTAMQDHNVRLWNSPNTIYGLWNRFVLEPIGFRGTGTLVLASLAVVSSAFLWFVIRNQKKRPAEPVNAFLEYFLLIALIPNLTHTDTEHFMWTWPLIAWSVSLLAYTTVHHKRWYIVLLVLAFIPYTVNSPDIVGRKLMLLFDEGGLLGLANLLIIAVAVVLFLRFPAKTSEPQGQPV